MDAAFAFRPVQESHQFEAGQDPGVVCPGADGKQDFGRTAYLTGGVLCADDMPGDGHPPGEAVGQEPV